MTETQNTDLYETTNVPFTCPRVRQLCRVESPHPPRHPPTAVVLTGMVNETAYTATEQEAEWAPHLVWTFRKKEPYMCVCE